MKLATLIGIMAVVATSSQSRAETGLATSTAPSSIRSSQLPTSKYEKVSSEFGKIHKGMTEAEVQQIIGSPSSKAGSSWIWRFTNIGGADEDVYVVFFTDRNVADVNHVKSYYTSAGKTNAEPAGGAYVSPAAGETSAHP